MKRIITFLAGLAGTVFIAAGMMGTGAFTYHAYALDEEESAWVEEAREVLQAIVQERDVLAVVYLADQCPIQQEPYADSGSVAMLPSGQTVRILDVILDDDYHAWAYISFYYGGTECSGYIPRDNLACSDEIFLQWEREHNMNPLEGESFYSAGEGTVSPMADVEQFPESYQPALLALKQQHPNWTFVAMNTGLDFDTVIASEMGNKSLVHSSLGDYMKNGVYDDGDWYYATEGALRYYMDPRNGLTEDAIFQFEQLTYNATYHTEAAVETFLQNTFMNSGKNAPGTNMTFAHIFWTIGAEEIRKVSPFHLAARVYQEQGQGDSPLISGTYPGYEGYYNYFNVKASGTSMKEVIESGLAHAREKGWNSAYWSILGGAEVISVNYIRKGQDTIYLQKYNVNPLGEHELFTHQYMQNISAPTSEGRSVRNLYAKANSLENTFVFKIPVYKNMPEEASPRPTATDILIQLPEGYEGGQVWLDGVPYTVSRQGSQYLARAKDTAAKSVVAYKYNEKGVPKGMYVWTLEYNNSRYTATPHPQLEDLLTYHGFSIRITGESGIRFKTGIDKSLRSQLLSGGVNGYRLKEYGTLIQNYANRNDYPMIKGGAKVKSGISYGVGSDGKKVDKVYETVDGRYRFTSVLIGMPPSAYKTEYAFRGYAVLEKDGQQTIIYGPVVAKSIYSLAGQVLEAHIYEENSEEDLFLKQLIIDAENAN